MKSLKKDRDGVHFLIIFNKPATKLYEQMIFVAGIYFRQFCYPFKIEEWLLSRNLFQWLLLFFLSISQLRKQQNFHKSVPFLKSRDANWKLQEMPSRLQKSAKKGSKSYLIFGPNQILETLRLDDRRCPDHENVCWWFLDRCNIITRSVKTKK